ncbi:putative protein YedJ [Vibrio stylophorae]|uniref:HD domain-containing protein n=1 Tax=Vibrio stylophorae TaxID=659351 RepID=A0ABM8ZWT4_9VIBR|nr:HD domain-containing protein [Vibrio stylophorae]CAH0535116.1 putative protein YedJ [Vibrio stylophorae]
MDTQTESILLTWVDTQMTQDSAHDLNHVLRVVKTAKQLCQFESAEPRIVIPAAYLHDCFSFAKNHPKRATSSTIAADKAIEFLASIDYPKQYHDAIHHAIVAHSFSANITPKTIEAKILQDADRLDALGAIGIARCIQVGSVLNIAFYDAFDPSANHRPLDDSAYSVDHFYLKLFKLAQTMHTPSAKLEAEKRTAFMQNYLAQLYAEVSPHNA